MSKGLTKHRDFIQNMRGSRLSDLQLLYAEKK